MDQREILRLAAADITPERYAELAAHGEDILVERKREMPEPEKFGAVCRVNGQHARRLDLVGYR